MKYLSVFAAICAVWVGIICIATIDQDSASRLGLYYAGLACTGLLFVIGFWKRA